MAVQTMLYRLNCPGFTADRFVQDTKGNIKLGKSPSRCFVRHGVAHAKVLLCQSNQSITQIFLIVGDERTAMTES